MTRLSATQFTYPITVSPAACSFSTTGVTVVTNSGGVDKDSLIKWVRGQDNVGDEQSPGSGITIRPSVHGDVLHSRPVVVNYGGSIGVVVFYGANDGVFRAINGNQPLSSGALVGGAPPGGEIFGFIPTEFYGKLKRLYLNTPDRQARLDADRDQPDTLAKGLLLRRHRDGIPERVHGAAVPVGATRRSDDLRAQRR